MIQKTGIKTTCLLRRSNENFEKGSVLYAEGYLGVKLEKIIIEIAICIWNELIGHKVLFPESIICLGGSFSIKPSKGGEFLLLRFHSGLAG